MRLLTEEELDRVTGGSSLLKGSGFPIIRPAVEHILASAKGDLGGGLATGSMFGVSFDIGEIAYDAVIGS